MSAVIIGKKIGMTQRFAEDGSVIPMTVVQAGPCVVVQLKTRERDGYDAVQLGLVEPGRKVRANKPMEGHFKKSGVAPVKVLREFKPEVFPAGEEAESVKVGDSIKVSVFSATDRVDVRGVSKGKGFAGVMKRYGFSGGKATHGSMHHRGPGSIGMAAYPARVMAGMKMPGQLGQKQITVKNLQVVEVIEEDNLLLLRGAVPGTNGTYLEIIKRK